MKIVIIGGEAAGMSAAAKAARTNPSADIIVYEASEIISFGACGLPYFVADEFQDPSYMAEFTPEQFAKRGIDVRTGHRVTKIDSVNKTLDVNSDEGTMTARYDRLMIATGAREIIPPIEGLRKEGVYSLRRMQDGIDLKAAIGNEACQHITVIGSGFIGLEVAEAMVHRGKKVRLIERASRLIPDAFDSEISKHFMTELRQAGVEVLTDEQVISVIGDQSVEGIITDKGEYQTDLVLVCTGVKPNTDFLLETGIEMLANGAIRIDQHGKTSLNDVWAAGDCASIPNAISGKDSYIPLATGANKLGRLVGEAMARSSASGQHQQISPFTGSLGTSCIRLLGLEAGRTGLSEREAVTAGLR
ncbi:CoA-disulfide reductase [Veronia nyctiphanis]|uniref:CoA-disulfide reductase n=1 Tax=Veronia nyctiphanis TaxID=1278244 RepID=UPI001F29E767|nr:CoA-disulfide reductase [Veronia nyctiphanis]